DGCLLCTAAFLPLTAESGRFADYIDEVRNSLDFPFVRAGNLGFDFDVQNLILQTLDSIKVLFCLEMLDDELCVLFRHRLVNIEYFVPWPDPGSYRGFVIEINCAGSDK
ncbi:MAG TPA: hypothetical protein VN631_15265, partial [Negativicutes bacterium]|nr:hypothetical protein [Negativicutes bacterium]